MSDAAFEPAAGAIALDRDLQHWTDPRGGPPAWRLDADGLRVLPGAGDLLSRRRFGDCHLHLEFRCPPMPGAVGQDRANSGVFLQGRYEIQILDSHGVDRPGSGDCGAVYRLAPPLLDACRPAGRWQTLECLFRAARGGGEPARLSAFLNGLPIHNNLALPAPTPGALDARVLEPGPLRLQDHGAAVSFRDIRLRPLPPDLPDHYQGQRREL